MTTLFDSSFVCSVCGETSEFQVIGSTNAFGPNDLDMRPPEMQRSTMPYWVQECPKCGYVADSIDEEFKLDRSFLTSESYATCDGRRFANKLAERFYRAYLIAKALDDKELAFHRLMSAVWSCDDAKDVKNARECRVVAADLAGELGDLRDYAVIRADILRRAGLFDKVVEEYSNFHSEREILEKVVAFHVKAAREKDDRRHTSADV